MKIYQALLLALLLLLSADSLTNFKSSESRKEKHIGLAYELEFEQTRDLKTNTIPSERLFAAKEFADQKRRQKSIANIQWQERGPNNVGGRTRTLLYDLNDPNGNTVFAGSVGGGLWRTTNINAQPVNWQPVDNFWSNIAIGSIAQNPRNPNEIYVGTGEGWFSGDAVRGNGIWKSGDGGNTWRQLPATQGRGYINKLVVGQNDVVLAAIRDVSFTRGGIYRSEDGGNTWNVVLNNSGALNIGADIEIAANGDLYASMGVRYSDGIYKSTDNGLTWTKIYNSKSDEFRIELACAPSNPNVVYALVENNAENGIPTIMKTTTGGAIWRELNTPLWYDQNCSSLEKDWTRGQDWFDLISIVDPLDENVVYIGAVDLFKTVDGGESWNQISHWHTNFSCGYPPERTVHADQHAMAFKPGSNSELLFGNDGGVYQTTNANTTDIANIRFSFKSDNYNVTQFYATATSNETGGNRFLAGAQDNGTQYYRGAGMNSTREVTGGDGAFCHIDEDDPSIQISSYIYNNYFITNNAWSSARSIREGNVGRFINPSDYDSETNTLYAAHEEGKYLYIKNVGTSNAVGTEEIKDMEGIISAVTVSPSESHRVFFATSRGELFRIDNTNADFLTRATAIDNGLPFGYISSIALESGNDDHILISYSNYGIESIWETKNGGVNWAKVEGDLPDIPIRWVEFNPNNHTEALAATELGVWTTNNLNGANTIWNPSNNGLANVRVNMLQFRSSDNFLVAATMGRGLFSSNNFSNQGQMNLTCSNLGSWRFDTTQLSITSSRVKNEGNLPVNEDFKVAYYLSKDNQYSADDVIIGTQIVDGLGVGEAVSLSLDVDLEVLNLPRADYFLGYYIDSDNKIQESNEEDNICLWESPRITVGTDTCESIAVIECGQTISGSTIGQSNDFNSEAYNCYGGKNPFDAPDKIYQLEIAPNTEIEIKLTDLTGNLSLFLLDDCDANASCLGVSLNSETRDEVINTFNLAGTYYLVVDAADASIQSDFNICVNCIENTDGQPNLYFRSIGTLAIEGEDVRVPRFEVQNNGNAYANASKLGFYLSEDTVISQTDHFVITAEIKELRINEITSKSFVTTGFGNPNIPDGNYYLGMILDIEDEVEESNEGDNTAYWSSPQVVIEGGIVDRPNLICDNLGLLSSSRNFLNILNLSIKNIGSSKADASYVGYYLSTDKTIDANDIYLGESAVRALNPRAKSTESFSTRLSNIPAGEYYIGVAVDYKEEIVESTREDNYYFYPQKYISSGNGANTPNLGSLKNDGLNGSKVTDFVLSPNPSRGKFQLHLQHALNEAFLIDVIDAGGKTIRSYNYPSTSEEVLVFDLSTLENVIYYVRFTSKETTLSKKLLLMK